MNRRSFLSSAFAVMVYLACGIAPIKPAHTCVQQSDSRVKNTSNEREPGGVTTWRATTHSQYWMLTQLPSTPLPAMDTALMLRDPLTFLYSLKATEAGLASKRLKESAKGRNSLDEEEVRMLEMLLQAYTRIKLQCARPSDEESRFKDVAKIIVDTTAQFWSIFRPYYRKVVSKDKNDCMLVTKNAFPSFPGRILQISRHHQLKTLHSRLQKAQSSLLYKWLNSCDMEGIFAMLAAVLYEGDSSTEELTKL